MGGADSGKGDTVISYTDFKDEKGNINWNALESARRASGESCRECGAFRLFATGPGLCGECDGIRGTEETEHRSRIRCSHCGHVQEAVGADDYERYAEGEHSVTCAECNEDFEIQTHVRYTFVSPERS